MPKAHLSFSFGTSAGLRRAVSCGWKRVLVTFTPHPFHRGPVAGSVTEGVVLQAPDSVCANTEEIGIAMRIEHKIDGCFMRYPRLPLELRFRFLQNFKNAFSVSVRKVSEVRTLVLTREHLTDTAPDILPEFTRHFIE
jgi:hypothetical protein